MLRIAICDDNILILEKLKLIIEELCREYSLDGSVDTFEKGSELLVKYDESCYDVVFLDIFMPYIDGFAVAHHIRAKREKTFLIFVTSQEELVYQIFEYEPYSFIRKRSDELIKKDMQEVIKRLSKDFVQEQVLTLDTAYHLQERVRIREIVYIFSEKNYMQYILTGNRRIKVRQTMQEATEGLEKFGFLRIHRGLLVNMCHITSINYKENGVYISTGEILEIGKTYKNLIGNQYLNYTK